MMIRRISSLSLGAVLALSAGSALADDHEGGGEEAGGEEAAPEGDAAGGDASGAASVDAADIDGGGKIKLGLRLGYGLPMGDAAKDRPMTDGVKGKIPIWLDLGYMVTPNIMVGLYAQYGIAMLADDACPDGADCSGAVIRFGLQGQYHLSPGESLNPWFGLGIGYEMASSKVSAGGAEFTGTTSGLEFANLQAGADFGVADNIGIGPFVSFSLGQYSSAKTETPAGSSDGDIEDKAMHMWLVLGVKGTFGF